MKFYSSFILSGSRPRYRSCYSPRYKESERGCVAENRLTHEPTATGDPKSDEKFPTAFSVFDFISSNYFLSRRIYVFFTTNTMGQSLLEKPVSRTASKEIPYLLSDSKFLYYVQNNSPVTPKLSRPKSVHIFTKYSLDQF
jgi:hypothetical protein